MPPAGSGSKLATQHINDNHNKHQALAMQQTSGGNVPTDKPRILKGWGLGAGSFLWG